VQALVRQLLEGKDRRTFLMIEKLFVVIEHPLPVTPSRFQYQAV